MHIENAEDLVLALNFNCIIRHKRLNPVLDIYVLLISFYFLALGSFLIYGIHLAPLNVAVRVLCIIPKIAFRCVTSWDEHQIDSTLNVRCEYN